MVTQPINYKRYFGSAKPVVIFSKKIGTTTGLALPTGKFQLESVADHHVGLLPSIQPTCY